MLTVIDTNVLLVSISSYSATHWIYKLLLESKFQIAYTTDILIEYEEQVSKHWHSQVATAVIQSLIEIPNAIPVTVFYKLHLISSDEDDNKFVDCAFAANAQYLVTEDKDFDILKTIEFPVINIVNLSEFRQILIEKNLFS
ncbi:MAG: putative toxin-antitoxin system toxin component, PIN family [Chitinophagaceae bacterium]